MCARVHVCLHIQTLPMLHVSAPQQLAPQMAHSCGYSWLTDLPPSPALEAKELRTSHHGGRRQPAQVPRYRRRAGSELGILAEAISLCSEFLGNQNLCRLVLKPSTVSESLGLHDAMRSSEFVLMKFTRYAILNIK